MFKDFKKEMVMTTIIYIVIGIILIVWPGTTAKVVSYIIAGAITVSGVINLVKYARQDLISSSRGHSFAVGAVLVAAGIYLFLRPETIISIFPSILGLFVLVNGFMKLQNTIDVARTGYEKWWAVFILSIVNIAIGIIVLVNPFETATLLIRIIGAGLVYSGLSDLVATLFLKGQFEKFEKQMDIIDEKKN